MRKGKLSPRGDGPFKVLEKINDNAYKIDLPSEYNVHNVFNVSDVSSCVVVSYYPWAERLKNNATVECNDNGAEFLEVQDSIIPSPSDYGPLVSPVSKIKQECVEKTFDFSASKLSALQALVESEAIQYPTRNEVVNALVYKCAANAASSANPHQLVQYMNIRESTSPPLPPTSIGNILTVFSTPIHKGDLGLAKIVADIRKSKNNCSTTRNNEHNEWVSEILNAYSTGKGTFHQRDCDVYISTSLCKYPFQELDFGWGKPSRARLGGHSISKYFALMNTHDGGIHVSVHLTEKEMSIFENDKHLLQFATPDQQQ
ncbi:acyltransferase Pun1-like [Lycium barbarum]|uniref:acyltransferase Pun1-like n=1 Tax=Lycium barbarum TaxID=112863 RepID=UPI00293E8612|nr:acyltransferase Pun1-like [Lycium barbarum]